VIIPAKPMLKSMVFCNVTPCSLVDGYQCFIGTCCLYFPWQWFLFSRLQGIISQKTTYLIFTLLKTSKPVFFVFGVNTWNTAQNVFQVLSSINTGCGDDDIRHKIIQLITW